MLHNYHTHVQRCRHAMGTEREYVESAITNGIKTLGFSDHAPYLFPKTSFSDEYYSPFRMFPDEIGEYVATVRALAKEYEKDIRILCGFEMEYYPDFHREEMEFLKQYSPDYLILGQHCLGCELDRIFPIGNSENDLLLALYVTQVLAALSTGDFLYVAHPDMPGYRFSEKAIQQQYRRLCEGAKRMNVPLEINLLGLRTQRHYPDKRFYQIAAEVGNDIVLGADSHSPQDVVDPASETIARQWIDELGLHLIEKIL